MEIEYLDIQNYRQYKDASIDFSMSDDDGRGITVIKGRNGAGKSNILNAITWALYGEEIHLSENNEGYPLVNTKKIAEIEEGDSAEVKVEVEMEDEDGKRHSFERSVRFRKNGKTDVSVIGGSKSFTYTKEVNNDTKIMSNPEYMRDLELPEDIKEYFFFDGEQLNRYFEEATNEKIRDTVLNVSQVEVLEEAIKHLGKRKKKFIKKTKDLSPEVEKINKQIEGLESSIKTLKSDIKELEEKENTKEQKAKEIREKLKDQPKAEELENRIEELEKQEETLEDQLEEKREKKRRNLIEKGPIGLSMGAILQTLERINEKIDKGEIPPDYRKEFIEGLLENGECICGTKLDEKESDEHTEKVKEYLERASTFSELETLLTDGRGVLRGMKTDVVNLLLEKQEDLNSHIDTLEEKLDQVTKEKDKKKAKLQNSDVEEIKRLSRNLEGYEDELKDIRKELGKEEAKLEKKEKKLKKLNKQLDEEIEKQEKHEDLKKVHQFCRDAEEFAESVKTEIMEEIRQKVEEETANSFFELIWKESTYTDVLIDDEYNVSVIDQDGWETLGTLSKGEKQSLALAFMAALNKVSGFYAPIIIDTPLGRIDPIIKENIAQNLPQYMKDRQLTLLVTGSEYTEEIRDTLKQHVGKEYKIDFREEEHGAEAKVVDYGE